MSLGAEIARLELARQLSTTSTLTRRRSRAAHVLNSAEYRLPAAAALVGSVLLVGALVLAAQWFVRSTRGPHERPLALSVTTAGEPFDRLHITHTVRDGDTLWKLALYYYGSGTNAAINRLRNANPDLPKDPRELKIGLNLKIPVA